MFEKMSSGGSKVTHLNMKEKFHHLIPLLFSKMRQKEESWVTNDGIPWKYLPNVLSARYFDHLADVMSSSSGRNYIFLNKPSRRRMKCDPMCSSAQLNELVFHFSFFRIDFYPVKRKTKRWETRRKLVKIAWRLSMNFFCSFSTANWTLFTIHGQQQWQW